jgi:uroporphyrinogen III methyltransferase/synthase
MDQQERSETSAPPGTIYLIGARPGDPGPLTPEAARAIAESDVVVYDDLVHPAVLSHARRDAELVFGGKRTGVPSITQTEIIGLLIRHALRGKAVAWLEGGDPYVAGRGAEEAEALAEAGIRWEVIPGVSARVDTVSPDQDAAPDAPGAEAVTAPLPRVADGARGALAYRDTSGE